ncbi:uncharacterized protein LOC103698544 [Phoenix dactylifera]|uniref:Uncharacterized protein LOC103698544 n=1 Tax=Phoenix dactylifera TaxID=42345 RepID=A0A8B7BJV6_PHODC|nr:uncharacterized protein LOC103698544 [Phoenix dactylifera]
MYDKKRSIQVVKIHLMLKGISPSYKTWVQHGEFVHVHQSCVSNDANCDNGGGVEDRMAGDGTDDRDELSNMLEAVYMGAFMNDDIDKLPNNLGREDAQNFDKLFDDAQRPVYPSCKTFIVLSFVIKMLHIKVDNQWSNSSFDMNMKENVNLEKCPICDEPRYKLNDGNSKKIPHKILWYFSLTPRLKRLFLSPKIAVDMRWHKEKRVDDETSRHPADGEEWKNFDRQHPEFSKDLRNVRLGLATDGFNPFGNMSTSYSMWPVIVMPYNLPPWKYIKKQFCMLSLLIPEKMAPGKEIDVYLRPLIDELKELWKNGVQTYDASSGSTFRMHAALKWTINDFPAYGNMSGWPTKGYLACLICNKDASSERLRSKIGYMGVRRFLPENHIWRKSKLFNGKSEDRSRPREFTGEEILEQINSGTYKPLGKHPSINKKRKRGKDDDTI